MPCSPIISTPAFDPNLRISRFLDLPKFLNLLTTKSLHFCRSDLMPDQQELLTPMDFSRRPYETKLRQIIEASVRLQVFINSWHISDVETAMMWRAYEGTVALVSTAGQLMTVLHRSSENTRVGQVCYHGELLASGSYDTNDLSLCKRPSFETDREFRAILWRENGPPQTPGPPLKSGIHVPVDLSALITTIVVSPHSEAWLLPTLKTLLGQFGLGHIALERSKLYDAPAWLR
jgi:hypothetical protein